MSRPYALVSLLSYNHLRPPPLPPLFPRDRRTAGVDDEIEIYIAAFFLTEPSPSWSGSE